MLQFNLVEFGGGGGSGDVFLGVLNIANGVLWDGVPRL